MSEIWKKTRQAFKKNLIAGMLVLLPIFATIWFLKVFAIWMDSFILSFIPQRFQPQIVYGIDIPGLGIVVTVLVVLLVGVFTRLYIGNKMVKLGDYIFSKIPIGRSVYSVTKDFLTGVFSETDQRFKSVALVEWPRPGCHMLAFVTGRSKALKGDPAETWVTLFLPTSPNPTSGFYIMLPEKDVMRLNMSTDKAFKLIVSAGVVSNEDYSSK